MSIALNSYSMPMSGLELDNQAKAEYFSVIENKKIVIESNIVKTIISPVPSFFLTPKENTRKVSSSENVTFIHLIKNNGNVEINPIITFSNLSNDDFDIINIEAYWDKNLDGIVNFGDEKINNSSILNLKYKEEKQIIIKGLVPNIIGSNNKIAKIKLNATLPTDFISDSAIDNAVFLIGPKIHIEALTNKNYINKGDDFELSFFAQNIGDYKAKNTNLYIDNVLTEKVFVKLEIPLNTNFYKLKEDYIERSVFYHYIGESDFSYHSSPPNDLSKIDSLIFTYNEMAIDEKISDSIILKSNNTIIDDIVTNFYINYKNGLSVEKTISNDVKIEVNKENSGQINFMDNDLQNYIETTDINTEIGLNVNSGACNFSRKEKDLITVSLKTRNLNDIEDNFILEETNINTGVFYINELKTKSSTSSIKNNYIIEVSNNDIIYAEFSCGDIKLTTKIYINPISTIVNSLTNKEIPNVEIYLIKESNTSLVSSISISENESVVTKLISDSNGQIKFPKLNKGIYRIDVKTEQTNYSFPSNKKIDKLPSGRFFDEYISYGKKFMINEDNYVLSIDIPIDDKVNSGLFISKKSDDDIYEIGDIVNYTIEINNKSGLNLSNLIIRDIMPIGLDVYKDNVYLNEKKVNFKKISDGFSVDVLSLENNENLKLTYKAKILSSFLYGNKKNKVYIYNDVIKSNIATNTIEIADPIINSDGVIFGKVFMDCNNNRIQDIEELGIPNVKLYLDTGHFIETDVEGKFNFKTIKARTYVLSIDKSTLPRNHVFHKIKSKNNNDSYSLFIDLKEGDFYKANFADGLCNEEFKKNVIERRNKNLDLSLDLGNRKYDNSSKKTNYLKEENSDNKFIYENNNDIKEQKFILEETKIDINEIVKNIDNNDLDFISLKDGDILPFPQMSIMIKGKVGSNYKLFINNEEIQNSRVGQKYILRDKKVDIWEYIALKFNSGENILELQQIDPFGNIRNKKIIKVISPGEKSKIKVSINKEKKEANGYSEQFITVEIVDSENININTRTPITLYAKNANWDVYDLNKNLIGIQTYIENGKEEFKLISPYNITEDILTIESGILKTEAAIKFKPNLKERVVAGIISLQAGNEINRIEEIDNNHVSLFIQGKIKGDTLLTLNYDNKNDKSLYEKIRPDEFYDIYGDGSSIGFEGETYKKLYIKIEKEKFYILYGYFTPTFLNNKNKIVTYQKTMPGLDNNISINDNLNIRTFIGVDGEKTISKEIEAKGISGPYNLLPNINNNLNWSIFIIEKDNSGNIISKEEQFINKDYIVNSNGFVYFSAPIFAKENKVYIRSEYYEIDGDNNFYTKGFTTEYTKNNFNINSMLIKEENSGYDIYGLSINKNVGKNKFEIEQSKSVKNDEFGDASRIKYTLDQSNLKFKIEASKVDNNYHNDYSSIKKNSESLNIELYNSFNKKFKIKNQVTYEQDNLLNSEAKGVLSGIQSNFSKNLNAEFNFKYIERNISEENNNYYRIINNILTYNPDWLPKSQIELNSDYDVENEKKVMQINSEYYIDNRSKFYLKHKIFNDFDSNFGLSTNSNINTSLGVNYEAIEDANVYSELRLRDTENKEELLTVFGANKGVKINKNNKLLMGFENETNWENNIKSESFYIGIEHKSNSSDIYNLKYEYSKTESDTFNSISFNSINRLDKNYAISNNIKYEYINKEKENILLKTNYIYRPIDDDDLNWMVGYEYNNNEYNDIDKMHYLKTYLNKDINQNISYMGHIGYKNKMITNYKGYWLTSRFMYDVTEKVDFSIRFGTLIDENTNVLIGTEIGRQFNNNIWLSIGYNLKNIKDNNYSNSSDMNNSMYLKLRIKLDNSLFFWLD